MSSGAACPRSSSSTAPIFADDFEDAAGYGWTVAEPSFDWAELVANKDREIDRLNAVYIRVLRENGVDILEATARIADAHTVEVGGRTVTAAYILVATGAWPKMPDIPGIEHVITSNEAFDLDGLPGRLVIVGGGYIAVEFAGIFNTLGVEVTEIMRGDTILRGFDEDMRITLADEMVKRGVDLRSDCLVRSIEKADGRYACALPTATSSKPTSSCTPPAAPQGPRGWAWKRSASISTMEAQSSSTTIRAPRSPTSSPSAT